MADVDFDDFDVAGDTGYRRSTYREAVQAPRRQAAYQAAAWQEETHLPLPMTMSRMMQMAGAACSLLLVIGVGWWGYKLAVRDVNGVPVVRAIEGPMRVAPKDPGGEVADHQGLSVNTIAALGTAAPPPDRLVLAPRPVELSYEDTPGLAAAGAPQPVETAAAAAPVQLAAAPVAPLATPAPEAVDPTGPDPDAVAEALAEALAAPLDDLAEEAPVADVATVDSTTAQPTIRPRARPGSGPVATDVQPVSLTEPTAPLPATAELHPSMIPAGTRLVQLGAFDTPEQARSEWVKLTNQFGPLMDGKALVVQAAESGGRTFYRLRAHGFADETEARSFCTTMLEQSASCIPVEQR